MKNDIKNLFAERIEGFRLPRYREIANMGLYLEQVTKYINGYLSSVGFPELTPSMVSNYVKKGVISPPIKKQYYADQIAYLFFVGVAKTVLSMESIIELCHLQRKEYSLETAYDYFCTELENMLLFIAGKKARPDDVGVTDTQTKSVFRNLIISASHVLYITNFFEHQKSNQ